MPILRHALLLLVAAAACGHASVQGGVAEQPTPLPERDRAVASPAAVSGAEAAPASVRPGVVVPTPRPAAPADTPPPFAFEPAIATAVARVDRGEMERDLAAIAGDRNDLTARPHLEAVTRMVETQLGRSGWTVHREVVRQGSRTADNVIAERPGSDPSRVVVVAAHLDTVPLSPGADDDGSGLAALLALARAVSNVPTRASLRLIAFAFEEDGLLGSSQYVAALPPPERSRIVAMLAVDMIGYRDSRPGSQRYPVGIERVVHQPLPDSGDFVAAVGLADEPILPAMEHARQYVPEVRAGTVPVRRWALVAAPDLLRADHAPFWLAGIPAVMIGDTGNFRNPNYHQPTDRLDTLDTEFATLAARWICASTLTLAGAR